LLDVVALLVDDPPHGLVRGQVGTVVERFEDHSEVEFSDETGTAYAEAAFSNDDLLVLHHHPIRAA
jgi:hypothetical protein